MKVDEDSLTSLLSTPALRAELALLVALCTDQMRRDVLVNFPEPEKTSTPASRMASPQSASLAGDLINLDEEESDQRMAAEDRRRRRDQDLASPQMQRMRTAAVKFLDAWRLSILRRVGEVLSVPAQAVRQRRAEYNTKAQSKPHWQDPMLEVPLASGEAAANGLIKVAVIPTPLTQFEESKRSKIVLCLLLLTLSLEHYTAHSRVLLQIIAASLRLPSSTLSDLESTVSHGLLSTAANMSAEESTKKEAANNAVGRRWKVGLATVAGAALIGVTGGLAAPFLAAGIGTVMGGLGLSIPLIGGYLGAMAGSTILIGGLFGSYGGRMTGRMMEKYAKEVEDFSFLPLREPQGPKGDIESAALLGEAAQTTHKLRLAIGVSGWVVDDDDITQPWHVFRCSTIEPFALRWEVSSLRNLGISISKVLKSYVWSAAKLELIRRTIFISLLAGLWPLGLLRIARVLDNPYSVAKARSDKAGRVLAQALMQKVQGERPVTLVGYSLGARVIYQALLVLAEQDAFGLVESVILIGTPASAEERDWRKVRSVVSGRLVNVYSREDYMLGFLYRTSSLEYGVAGLQALEGVDRVENYDATKLMDGKGHAKYRHIVGQILRDIGFEDIDLNEVEKEELSSKIRNEGLEDLIPTEDLLSATELPTEWEDQIMEKHDAKGAVQPKDDQTLHQSEKEPLRNSEQQMKTPNREIRLPQTVGKEPFNSTSANLIETSPEPSRPTTPTTEDEDCDAEFSQQIKMVDLDPEPIL